MCYEEIFANRKLLRVLRLIAVCLLFIVGFFHPLNALTQDLGRHIKTGEIILETKQIPTVNLYSYTYPDFPFINHHWLSEVIFYIVSGTTGFNGLLLFSTGIVVFSFSLLVWYSLRFKNILATTIISFLYLQILFERTDVRPEIFSFLFLSLYMVILYSFRTKFTKWIFLLPLLELLWVTMHIYFPIGILIIGLFLVDAIIKNRKQLFTSHTKILLFILILSSLSTLCNPQGIQGALYPFTVFNNYGYQIEENQNIFFLWSYSQKLTILYFTLSLLLVSIILFMNTLKTKLVDWLLVLLFTLLAVLSIRNFPLFVFATFIPACFVLSKTLEQFSLYKPKKLAVTLLVLLSLFVWSGTHLITRFGFGFGIPTGATNGIDFLQKEKIQGPLFNNFDIGSYMEYRLYPKQKVFVDGRPEAYPKDFFEKTYIPMHYDPRIFKKVDQTYHFQTIFFSYTDQTPWAQTFLGWITKDPLWDMVYLDDYVVIFLKNTPEHSEIIKKLGMYESSLHISHLNTNDMKSLSRLVYFFQTVGWRGKEEEMYKHILTLNPTFCPALKNLSLLLSERQDPSLPIYREKLNKYCQ